MGRDIQRLTYLHVIANVMTGGRAYRGDPNSPIGFLTLTATGRKSGKVRSTHLVYIRDGVDYVIIASNGGAAKSPGWYYNVQSSPQVSINIHGGDMPVVAELAPPEKRRELWARLLKIAPLYGGYETKTQREIPMILLHPVNASH